MHGKPNLKYTTPRVEKRSLAAKKVLLRRQSISVHLTSRTLSIPVHWLRNVPWHDLRPLPLAQRGESRQSTAFGYLPNFAAAMMKRDITHPVNGVPEQEMPWRSEWRGERKAGFEAGHVPGGRRCARPLARALFGRPRSCTQAVGKQASPNGHIFRTSRSNKRAEQREGDG
jgi:hypothetical protein